MHMWRREGRPPRVHYLRLGDIAQTIGNRQGVALAEAELVPAGAMPARSSGRTAVS